MGTHTSVPTPHKGKGGAHSKLIRRNYTPNKSINVQIIEHRSNHFYSLYLWLPPSLSLPLSLVIEWIISCQGPWNHTPNPELPFLLASKIFIRTIRSSDKASTEGWGARGREGRMCQQDVCSATLYTQTTDLSSSIWDTAASLFAPSQARQPGEGGTVPASPPTPPHPPPSQQALLCPRPWAGGVGRTARTVGGGGHKGKLIVARANSQKPLCMRKKKRKSKVPFQPFSQQGHSGTQRVDLWFWWSLT